MAERQGSSITATYLRGLGLISRKSGAATQYYLHNAHGDVVALTSTAGAVQKRYTYDAFGNEASPSASDQTPFRYCGEYFDKETGSYYLRARYYDPTVGRFTQQDTYKGNYKDPLSLNLYTYCHNDPVRYGDPSGHNPLVLAGIAFSLLALLAGCTSQDAEPYFTFDPAPVYAPEAWNNTEYQSYTNCYAYAFNMKVNPLTGDKFPKGGMQPGMLCGEYDPNWSLAEIDAYWKPYLTGKPEGNQALVDLVTKDANCVGLNFLPYEDGMTGGYKVALVIKPGRDYHWYRQDAGGTWSHKQGTYPVIQTVGFFKLNGELYYNSDGILNPQIAASKVGYPVFVGYYYIVAR